MKHIESANNSIFYKFQTNLITHQKQLIFELTNKISKNYKISNSDLDQLLNVQQKTVCIDRKGLFYNHSKFATKDTTVNQSRWNLINQHFNKNSKETTLEHNQQVEKSINSYTQEVINEVSNQLKKNKMIQESNSTFHNVYVNFNDLNDLI